MKKIVTSALIIVLIIFVGIFIAYQWYSNAIYTENIQSEDIAFTVNNGDNLLTIASKLEQSRVIASEQALKIYVRLNNITANIKAGQYAIPKGTNVPNVIKILEEGTFKVSIAVTIPEGMRYEQIADLLVSKFESSAQTNNFVKSEFIDICENPDKYTFDTNVSAILNKYKPASNPLRGLLFPDTYRFDFDSNAKTVVSAMLLNFDKRLTDNGITLENLNKNQNNLTSIYDVISLASIIEKEAGNDADRPLVSGIFHNRLKVNYPLQSDITIHFIKNDEDTFISFADTKIESPYNTYLYAGVTPTPINNPGISSIKAALNPTKTEYFYFIYDANGTLYYAKTYEEHIANVNRYL